MADKQTILNNLLVSLERLSDHYSKLELNGLNPADRQTVLNDIGTIQTKLEQILGTSDSIISSELKALRDEYQSLVDSVGTGGSTTIETYDDTIIKQSIIEIQSNFNDLEQSFNNLDLSNYATKQELHNLSISTGNLTSEQLSLIENLQGLNTFYDENIKSSSIAELNGINAKFNLDDTYTLQNDGDYIEFVCRFNEPNAGYLKTTGLFGMNDGTTRNCIGFNNSSNFYVRGNTDTWFQFINIGVNHDVFNKYKLIIEGTSLVLYVNGSRKNPVTPFNPISINGCGSAYGTSFVNASIKSFSIHTSLKSFNEISDIKNSSLLTKTNLTYSELVKNIELSPFSDKLKLKFNGTDTIKIYKPLVNRKYVLYNFNRSQFIENSDNWRISMISICNEDFTIITNVLNGGAIETAIKISENDIPADDFIGGQAHGDEVLTEFICFIDGVKKNLNTSFELECIDFEFIQKSNLFAPPGVSYVGEQVAKDVIKWGIYSYKSSFLSHNLTFLRETKIVDLYLFMLPILRKYVDKQITDTYAVSNDYVEFDVTNEGHTNNQMFIDSAMGGNVKIWSNVSSISANVNILTGWGLGSHFNVSNSPSYNKLYFDFTSANKVVNVGDNYKCSVEFDILYNKYE
jgi:hypothetical protein